MRGKGNAGDGGLGDEPAQARLARPGDLEKRRVKEQIFQPGVAAEGLGDPVEKGGADDAAASPDSGDVAQGQIPAVIGRGGLQKAETLGVGDDLGHEQGLLQVGEKLFRVRVPQVFRSCQEA